MKYILKVCPIKELGGRKNQEDSTYPPIEDIKDSDRTFVLCDGMGGHDAGEVASDTVCTAMGNSILNDGHDAEGVFTDDDLKKALDDAFAALDLKDNHAEKKMGTTMTFLKLHNEGATIAHMGDSRVYHIRPGKDNESTEILHETRDHSLVNDLIKANVLTKEEARLSKQKNVITRAMQPNMEYRPKVDVYHTSDIKAGDYFYMCSDGMLEQEQMESGESIRNIFSDKIATIDEKKRILEEATADNKDNHTALIIRVEEVIDDVLKSEEGIPTQTPTAIMAAVDDEENTLSPAPDDNTENIETPNEAKPKQGKKEKSNKALLKIGIVVSVIIAVIISVYLVFRYYHFLSSIHIS